MAKKVVQEGLWMNIKPDAALDLLKKQGSMGDICDQADALSKEQPVVG